ncbi:MAG: thermonuclease family protein [Mycobacteriales bacterium]
MTRTAAVVLAAGLLAGCGHRTRPGTPPPDPPASMPADADGPLPVLDVVDGDTLTVRRAGTVVTVRLLGVDTPETVDPDEPGQCYGPEAAARAGELLTGQRVWLETDPSQDRVDRYGRELAYVWLPGDRLVNLQLLTDGYAREYTHTLPYAHQAAFRAAEAAAVAAQRGLWSPAACPNG